MTSRRTRFVVGIAMTALLAGCDRGDAPPVDVIEIRAASAGGIEIGLAAPTVLNRIRVLDDQQRIVRETPFAGRHQRYYVPIVWEPAKKYVVELRGIGRTARYEWPAPESRPSMAGACEAPAGQDPITLDGAKSVAVLAPTSGEIELTLSATNLAQSPGEFGWTVKCGPGATLSTGGERWRQDARAWRFEGSLALEHEFSRETLHVAMDQPSAEVTIKFSHRSHGAADFDHETLRMTIAAASDDELRSLVTCGELLFPTDSRGEAQLERSREEVALPNAVWSRVLEWMRPTAYSEDRYAEYAWQTAALTNRSQYPLNLAIQSEVSERWGGEPLLDFAPPAWKAPRESPVSEFLLRLAPGETAPAILPLYVRPTARPGDYERHVRVMLVGSDRPLCELSAPLFVTQGNALRSMIVAVCLAGSCAVWCLTPWLGRRLLRSMSVENLTTIALLSGAHFLVAYAARWGGDVLAGLTGPFAVFLAGIGNEGLTSMLIAALLVLVPRVGVIALSSLTVFALQAMFTGQLGLVDLLMVTVSIVVQESLAWMFGITRGGQRAIRPRDRVSIDYALRMALSIGLGNAIALYAQFCLVTVLYRLYFATWYIVAVALVTGLIYGGLGAAGGASLGIQLRRTAR